MKLIYVCDDKRHLICVPYSIENLHIMAKQLKIKRIWFHKNHYDIPVKRIEEIKRISKQVDTRNIMEIIQHPEYANIILENEVPKIGASSSDHFTQTEFQYNGNNQKD